MESERGYSRCYGDGERPDLICYVAACCTCCCHSDGRKEYVNRVFILGDKRPSFKKKSETLDMISSASLSFQFLNGSDTGVGDRRFPFIFTPPFSSTSFHTYTLGHCWSCTVLERNSDSPVATHMSPMGVMKPPVLRCLLLPQRSNLRHPLPRIKRANYPS